MASLAYTSHADGDGNLLAAFFSEFLDENEFSDFRRLEKLVASLKERGGTYAGHPAIRPRDCGQITDELRTLFDRARPQFRLREAAVVERFEKLIGEFTAFCASVYPSEASSALALHGQVLLFMGEPARVVEVLESWVARPYALEGAGHILHLVNLYAQAHLRLGTLQNVGISFIALGDWLTKNAPGHSKLEIVSKLAPLLQFDKILDVGGLRVRLIRLVICPLLSGPKSILGLVTKEEWNGT